MLGVAVLNWYPNRNPSDEIRRTTGWGSLDNGRAVDAMLAEEGVWNLSEEKKRKAKAPEAARAMQVMRRREMKTMVVVCFWGGPEEESVLKESRAVD